MSYGAPSERLTDERTILAVGFANAVLVELVFVVCQLMASHLFGFLLDIEPPEHQVSVP